MNYPFTLQILDYNKEDFDHNIISPDTFKFHYGKHHATYVKKLNELLKTNENLQKYSLEDLIKNTYRKGEYQTIFNNAAQVWNHNFYWKSITPKTLNIKEYPILENMIKDNFNNIENFYQTFKKNGLEQFGSGWVWLTYDRENNKLDIIKTSNANTPITTNKIPLITCDVWEHAYYLDYQNDRKTYLDNFLHKIVNWSFAENNLKKALS